MAELPEQTYPIALVPHEDRRVEVEVQYADGSANVEARWRVADSAIPAVDITKIILGLAGEHGLSGREHVLDVGCGTNANHLIESRSLGCIGQRTALDPYVDVGSKKIQGHNATLPEQQRITVLRSTLEAAKIVNPEHYIPGVNFARESAGLVIAEFVVQHAQDQELFLRCLEQVTAVNGLVAVAATGRAHKSKQRAFERAIGEDLKVTPPRRFNEKFPAEKAEEILSKHFEVIDRYPAVFAPIYSFVYYGPNDYADFLDSLRSMRTLFRPTPGPSEFERSILEVVVPDIKEEIRDGGFFSETVDRRVTLCRKTRSVTNSQAF
jgi:hypothetical protein